MACSSLTCHSILHNLNTAGPSFGKTLPTHSPHDLTLGWHHGKNITHQLGLDYICDATSPFPLGVKRFLQFRTLRIKEKTNICPGGDKGISKMMRKGTKTSKSWSSSPKKRDQVDDKKTNMMALRWLKDQAGIDSFCWASGWYDWYTMLVWWTVTKELKTYEPTKEKDKKTSQVYDNPSIVICGATVLQIEQYLTVAIWILNMLQYLPIHDSKNPYPVATTIKAICCACISLCVSTVCYAYCQHAHSSSGLDGASANVGFTLLQGMLQEENLPCSCTVLLAEFAY